MKNRFISTDILIVIMSAISLIFGAALAYINPIYMAAASVGILIIVLLIICNAATARKLVKSVFYGSGKHSNMQQLSFENLAIPVAVISKDTIVWYNDSFKNRFMNGNDSYLTQL